MTPADLTPAELAALRACAAGDVWCGLGLAQGCELRQRLRVAGLIKAFADFGGAFYGRDGYRVTAAGLALLPAIAIGPGPGRRDNARDVLDVRAWQATARTFKGGG